MKIYSLYLDESTEHDLNFDDEIAEIDEMREEVDEARKLGMNYTWNSFFFKRGCSRVFPGGTCFFVYY